MNSASQRLLAIVLLGLAIGREFAPAAIIPYSSLSSFLSASGPISLESFEEDGPLTFATHPPFDLGPFTVSSDGRFGILTTGPTDGCGPTEGAYYLGFQSQTVEFIFEEPVTALSLDFVDYGDITVQRPLSMSTSAGDSIVIKEPGPFPGSGVVFFFGFTSDTAVSTVTFHLPAGNLEGVALDAVRYASVPEPSLVHLWTCGALWLLSRRRTVSSTSTKHPA